MIVRDRSLRRMLAALVAAGVLACPDEEDPVCPDCDDASGYRIEFANPDIGLQHPGAVLFSGWRNASCRDDLVCTGASEVLLGDVRWGDGGYARECDEENRELIAFASGHRPHIATPQVPAGTELRAETEVVSVNFQSPVTIPVAVWLVLDQAGGGWPADAAIA